MKLASIEKIEKVYEHPNADKLQLVKVLGFQCVVPIGLYKEGDLIIYIQPDTVLPKDQQWAEEYLKYSPKRVRACKIRQEWSEGIVAPFDKFKEIIPKNGYYDSININLPIEIYDDLPDWISLTYKVSIDVGDDISEMIGVVKYDPPLPKDIQAKGGLPYQISKTDEDRFENLGDKIPYGEKVDIDLKIDGQSATYGYKVDEDRFFITGRRFEIDHESENRYSVHVKKVKEKIINYCKKHNVSLAFRGESYGNGIQSHKLNPHSSKPHSLAIFSVWNIDERKYENKNSKHYYENACKEIGLETVDMLEKDVILTEELIKKYSLDLKKLPNGNHFEGVVIKHKNGSFKIINKYYDSNK